VQILLWIYVDDIIMANSCDQAIDALHSDLRSNFALKHLGQLSYFLGIEVKPCSDGIILTQEKYTNDILYHASLQHCKPMHTPLAIDEKLSLTDALQETMKFNQQIYQ
jgi:hypothetical protein